MLTDFVDRIDTAKAADNSEEEANINLQKIGKREEAENEQLPDVSDWIEKYFAQIRRPTTSDRIINL